MTVNLVSANWDVANISYRHDEAEVGSDHAVVIGLKL
jgi:hypothetical protein